jgi:small subunit ribosomal protein S17
MPKKKEEIEQNAAETTDVTAEEASAAQSQDAPQSEDNKSAKAEETDDAPSIIESITETVSAAVETVANAAAGIAETVAETVGLGAAETTTNGRGNRAEKVGVVQSDKMQKTVVVRVDRLVKHPMYRKYVRRKKNFMAHDELGATVGDKVRIIETRPLSARKRWRVVEIIQKAEK